MELVFDSLFDYFRCFAFDFEVVREAIVELGEFGLDLWNPIFENDYQIER